MRLLVYVFETHPLIASWLVNRHHSQRLKQFELITCVPSVSSKCVIHGPELQSRQGNLSFAPMRLIQTHFPLCEPQQSVLKHLPSNINHPSETHCGTDSLVEDAEGGIDAPNQVQQPPSRVTSPPSVHALSTYCSQLARYDC